jgi:hypothetical protein
VIVLAAADDAVGEREVDGAVRAGGELAVGVEELLRDLRRVREHGAAGVHREDRHLVAGPPGRERDRARVRQVGARAEDDAELHGAPARQRAIST